jgi:hypothetical protein
MDIVFLELKQLDDRTVELRYRVPGQIQYQSQNLSVAEIARLYDLILRVARRTLSYQP